MRITILCSDEKHPVNLHVRRWINGLADSISAELVRQKRDASGGDLLFLISCTEIVTEKDRKKYGACLVLHASDLPRGRGWSPHIWELVGGAHGITLSLLEAADPVDSGKVWQKRYIPIPKHALWYEINECLFQAELELLDFAVAQYGDITPIPQDANSEASYYRRRRSTDSEIDPRKSIAEQFDLIRVCDPDRFPAYFDYLGHRYRMRLEKHDDD